MGDRRRRKGRGAPGLLALAATASILAAACGSNPVPVTPTGAIGVTTPSATATQANLPLRRGFLEIGTYETEIFRPAFTIDIPVSSTWGTFGETGRRVLIGGNEGFFGLLALTTSEGQQPTASAFLRTLRAGKDLDIDSVAHPQFAGLSSVNVAARTGRTGARIAFGGQHIGLPPRSHARLWLVEVGKATVMVVLAGQNATFQSFSGDAMEALDSIRFEAA